MAPTPIAPVINLHEKGNSLYSCKICRNHIALCAVVISKNFKGKSGQAYLFSHAMNIVVGAKKNTELVTGYHTIAKIFCSRCGQQMGWTYVKAFEERERYKEGKYVLEKAKIVKEY